MEGRLKQSGLLEELIALLFGVKPVGGSTSQVEDASPAMEGAVEQVQDELFVFGRMSCQSYGDVNRCR